MEKRAVPETLNLRRLTDLWDEKVAQSLGNDLLALLRYRSNLLGADLRITNFGGGNTSSKILLPDPFSRQPVRVLAVKGSGGDLGSISESGFALLYLDRLEQLKELYRGEQYEDDMVAYYPLAAFGANRVAASIDTPLHAFLPFPHVDHLHPDWAIALAASANGRRKLEEFNQTFGRHLLWVPWKRPGFELALLLEKTLRKNPNADGIVLANHGLFTWGTTPRECYLNSIQTIDEMGEFVKRHEKEKSSRFGGVKYDAAASRSTIAVSILPLLRGLVSSNVRMIGHYSDSEEALAFASSEWAPALSELGTSCPDHFLRTRVCPMYVEWDSSAEDVATLRARIHDAIAGYRVGYERYYTSWATPESPKLRDTNPTVVVIPGLGVFGFGRDKREARITTEFFQNAIRVMAGATALDDGMPPEPLPHARTAEQSKQFTHFHNYVALPRGEAFRIEYWVLEEAKLKRLPPEAKFERRIFLVVGGASGIGREVALLLARQGAHLVVSDADESGAATVAREAAALSSSERVATIGTDLTSSALLADTVKFAVQHFGGLDGIVITAGLYPVITSENQVAAAWEKAFSINVTGNYLLAREAEWAFSDQSLPAVMVLTSSANAIVPKHGSEAYDTSKAALNHLVRELAIKLSPTVRVNGIAPATVIAGSAMFPRDRVIQSLEKYGVEFQEFESAEELRRKLAVFYARRSLTKQPVHPEDCARAILWLLSDESCRTTGHVLPVDGGLSEAFLR